MKWWCRSNADVFPRFYQNNLYLLLRCYVKCNFKCCMHNLPFLPYLVGRGANGDGFNFKLAMVKMCSTWTLFWTNMPFQKVLKYVFRPNRHPSPPPYGLWKRSKIENLIFFKVLPFVSFCIDYRIMLHCGNEKG